jgi:hypothetical protein
MNFKYKFIINDKKLISGKHKFKNKSKIGLNI